MVHDLIVRNEYTIRGEFLWFGLVLHSDVHVWNKSVLTKFRKDVDHITSISWCPVYAFQTDSCDPKKRRFIKMMGLVFDHYRYTDNGDRAEMYIRHPLD